MVFHRLITELHAIHLRKKRMKFGQSSQVDGFTKKVKGENFG